MAIKAADVIGVNKTQTHPCPYSADDMNGKVNKFVVSGKKGERKTDRNEVRVGRFLKHKSQCSLETIPAAFLKHTS